MCVAEAPCVLTFLCCCIPAAAQVEEGSKPSRSFVELQFLDNETHKLFTADLKLQDILRLIQQKTTEMEARTVFKEVNFNPEAAPITASKAATSSSSGKS